MYKPKTVQNQGIKTQRDSERSRLVTKPVSAQQSHTQDSAYDFLTEMIDSGRYDDHARQIHETWRSKKEEEGWKLGAFIDEIAKSSPYIVQFDLLSAEQKGQYRAMPYAVANFFRQEAKDMTLIGLESLLLGVSEDRKDNAQIIDRLCEYVFSHNIAIMLMNGAMPATEADMHTYESQPPVISLTIRTAILYETEKLRTDVKKKMIEPYEGK